MTDNAYIVANKKQELDVLKKFEQGGLLWNTGEKPTKWITSEQSAMFGDYVNFPYALIEKGHVAWLSMTQITDQEIVYDGRKEENKYKVTQGFMNELIKWRDEMNLNANDKDFNAFVDGNDIKNVPDVVYIWWRRVKNSIERNDRLIAIIQCLSGKDVFEVEKQRKFVVRSEHTDRDGDYIYVGVDYEIFATYRCDLNCATKFDTREESQEWANSHQVVVEIDAEGNEVE